MTTTRTNRETEPVVPEWDLADRLTKSLRVAGIGVSDMANLLGVTRDTISRWINGHYVPKRAALLAWASITDVDLHWLETGEEQQRTTGRYRPSLALVSVRPDLTPESRTADRPTVALRIVS